MKLYQYKSSVNGCENTSTKAADRQDDFSKYLFQTCVLKTFSAKIDKQGVLIRAGIGNLSKIN